MKRIAIAMILATVGLAQSTPGVNTVSLSWGASASIPPQGQTIQYNVYRKPGACAGLPTTTGATKLNIAPIAGLTYDDALVPVGVWCYVGTAVLSGAPTTESGPSVGANATIQVQPMINFTVTVKVALDITQNGATVAHIEAVPVTQAVGQ